MAKTPSKALVDISFATLKARHRAERDTRPDYPNDFSVRVHRALSWLQAAEKCTDLDTRFILLWISFNAAYAREFEAETPLSEQKVFGDYLKLICSLDEDGRLYQILWGRFSQEVRMLLENKYIFREFWLHVNGKLYEEDWEPIFKSANRRVKKALDTQNSFIILKELFSRLYILRNQLVHGGATFESTVNREQVKHGVQVLERLVPVVISTMLDSPDQQWGAPTFPVQ